MKLTKEILEQYNDAWLLKYAKEPPTYNPLDILKTEDPIEFEKKLTWLLTQPDYFAFLCKHIFNVDLMPFQVVVLQELWKRKFPMLIGSRGMGKAIRPDEKIRVKNGWTTIKDLKIGDQVYSSNGTLCNVVYKTDLQKNLKMYRITLRDGRTIDCCEDHMWKVWDKNKNRNKNKGKMIWSELKTKDMVNSYSISRTGEKSNGFEYRYALPVNLPIVEDDEKSFELHPYVVGVLLGDGCLGQRQISLSSLDREVIDRFTSLLPYGYVLKSGNNKDYRIVRSDKSVPPFHEVCKRAGIYGYNSHTKFIPDQYKYSGINNLTELMFGLMDTDGYSSKEGVIEYYTVSERLKNDFVDVVRSLGIQCRETIKESWIGDTQYSDCYRVSIYTDKPVFSLSRKLAYLSHTKSKAGRSKFEKVFITKIERIEDGDGYCIQVDSPDRTYITKDYIVTHNTFLLGLYCLMRALLLPGRKIVIAGAGFRQSKFVHEYMENIWRNAPVLQDLCDQNSGGVRAPDVCTFRVNDSVINALPIGDGSKIRGYRANDLITDEFASHSREIFETVLAGFGNVSANVVDSVRLQESIAAARQDGYEVDSYDLGSPLQISNQIVISGTAYYDFNHFAEYWKKWRKIILSKGDKKVLEEIFDGKIEEGFDWRQYGIIRIPYNLLPKGFMDEGNIARSRASVHSGIFDMEYMCIFSSDSKGFFKRSLIEGCTANEKNSIVLPSGPVIFDAMLRGNPNKKYVIGVDPASEVDNFAVVVLEVNEDHRRIVYSWTMNRQAHTERVKLGLTSIDNFYAYCARKIRDLMKLFPTERIMMDSQGGGIMVSESLHDSSVLLNGELPIWPIIEENKEKPSDDEVGLHILELVNFASSDWTNSANHSLRKDMEDKTLLFPKFDPLILGLSAEDDKANNRLYDTLEDCVMEIEEMKNELTLIEITQTANGRDRWDTPEVKLGANKKKRMRKDRYSALLMANAGARAISLTPAPEYQPYGGFSKRMDPNKIPSAVEYIGPSWFTEGMRNVY